MLFKIGSQGANCWHQYNCFAIEKKIKTINSSIKKIRGGAHAPPLERPASLARLAKQVGVAG